MSEPIGPFTVLDTLGQGAGSTILKVRRKADERVYALKVIVVRDPDDMKFVSQAEHEYTIGGRLDHPNIVKFFGFETIRRLFKVKGARLWMEFIDGLPLSRCRDLPLVRLVAILFRVADGMTYMHHRGVFHADMKPDNVMVTGAGEVKIIDLGLAWRKGETKDRVQGTIEFLAPEQAKRKIVNEKTDIFNFGATMYRAFTKSPVPEHIRDPAAGLVGDVDSLVRPLTAIVDGFPPALDQLVRECIRQDPDRRPYSMKEVRDRLRDIGKALKRPPSPPAGVV